MDDYERRIIEESQMYMQNKQFKEANELLAGAIKKEPTFNSFKLKLLETIVREAKNYNYYYSSRDFTKSEDYVVAQELGEELMYANSETDFVESTKLMADLEYISINNYFDTDSSWYASVMGVKIIEARSSEREGKRGNLSLRSKAILDLKKKDFLDKDRSSDNINLVVKYLEKILDRGVDDQSKVFYLKAGKDLISILIANGKKNEGLKVAVRLQKNLSKYMETNPEFEDQINFSIVRGYMGRVAEETNNQAFKKETKGYMKKINLDRLDSASQKQLINWDCALERNCMTAQEFLEYRFCEASEEFFKILAKSEGKTRNTISNPIDSSKSSFFSSDLTARKRAEFFADLLGTGSLENQNSNIKIKMGKENFKDYIAFECTELNLIILEKFTDFKGNATYILPMDLDLDLGKITRKELVAYRENEGQKVATITHRDGKRYYDELTSIVEGGKSDGVEAIVQYNEKKDKNRPKGNNPEKVEEVKAKFREVQNLSETGRTIYEDILRFKRELEEAKILGQKEKVKKEEERLKLASIY